MHAKTGQLHYGKWSTGDGGLPCFDLIVEEDEAVDAPFNHLISSGHLSAMADRWGNVNLFTTEGGFVWLNSPTSTHARGSIYLMTEVNGELISLIYGELNHKEGIRVGVGFVEYRGVIEANGIHLRVVQQFFAPPNKQKQIYARFAVTNLAPTPFQGQLEIRGDVCLPVQDSSVNGPASATKRTVTPPDCAVLRHEQLGEVFFMTPKGWHGTSKRSTLRLYRDARIEPGCTLTFEAIAGYGSRDTCAVAVPSLEEVQGQWAQRLAPFVIPAAEPWMERECLWNMGQLLSFCSYDSSVAEYYISLGGYGWAGFSVREVSQTSMVLAPCDWDLTAASLRFVAKTQLTSGDVPKFHTMRRDRVSRDFDSDNELWFLLGCCESVMTSGRTDFLDEVCPFWDTGQGTIWEHMKRAFYWVRDGIGTGKHGLILIREGDWNDYLSLMGAEGRGESVMNSAMACRAFAAIVDMAWNRNEKTFAQEVEVFLLAQRQAVADAFDQGWFRCGYTDAGKPVGSHAERRVFLNAQSWPVLGKCGTQAQRRLALRNAIEYCHTDIGLMLMSRPYSSPAPDDISSCSIPAGEGENAGIWPQTAHWFVWALCEEGMLEEALTEWKCATLHSHARHFPKVPFGIFNGPDCFSSKWAGKREGGTQVQLLNRGQSVPMNPMVAWQAFTLRKINQARENTLILQGQRNAIRNSNGASHLAINPGTSR